MMILSVTNDTEVNNIDSLHIINIARFFCTVHKHQADKALR